MEEIPFEVIEFKNFNTNEIADLGNTLAKIFTRRLILEEKACLFPDFEKLYIWIQDGEPEIFSIPSQGLSPKSWIPDAKLKIYTNSDANKIKFEYNVSKIVWLEIITDSDIEKSKKEVMDFVSKNPENVVLTCLVNKDEKCPLLVFRFYLIRGNNHWEKIKEYYYTNFKDSDSVLNIEYEKRKNQKIIEFKNLSTREKGEIGETLAKIFTKRLLLEKKSLFFPEFEKDFIRIEEGGLFSFINPKPSFFSDTTNNFGSGSWEPDGAFQIFSNNDPFDLIFELNPKKMVFLEVKTGMNAHFSRSQQPDMEDCSTRPNFIVLFSQVFPENKHSILIINLFVVIKNSDWKVIKQYYYSDFPLYKTKKP